MNDAYTIGVTLALEDGVSGGIETIRRELNGLDQAIVVSTANLVRLQEVARGAVSAGVAQAGAMAALARDSASAAARQATVPSRQAVASEAEAVPADREPRGNEQSAPAASPVQRADPGNAPLADVTFAPLPQTPSAGEGPVRRPAEREEMAASPTGPRQQSGTQASAPVPSAPVLAVTPLPLPQPPTAMDPRATAAAPSERVVQPPPPGSTVAPPVQVLEPDMPVAAPMQRPVAAAPAPAPVAIKNKDIDQPTAPTVRIGLTPPADADRRVPSPTQTPQAPSMAPPTRPTQMAPTTEVSRRLHQPEHVGSAAPRQSSDRSHEKPMSGTIVVDGMELGRWMADYLAHAASRPPSGGVAFDPRMTPVWAGAPIGA